MKTLFLLFIFPLLLFATSIAQQKQRRASNPPFVIGKVDRLYSKTLSEKRTLNIYLPTGYDTSKKDYPVIYLLDGSENEDFLHIAGLVNYMNMIEVMPQAIVVGIANVDRVRDFTFPITLSQYPKDAPISGTPNPDSDIDFVFPTTIAEYKKDFPTSGGSSRFISFIEKEVQPYIAKNYRVNNSKTIIGQSLGGLLTTEILLKKPQLFNTYIIVSPSLWWDSESLLTSAPNFLKSLPASDLKVYLSVGTEGKKMEGDAAKLKDLLLQNNRPNITTIFNPMPEENHLTILHNSVYQAFQKLYPKK